MTVDEALHILRNPWDNAWSRVDAATQGLSDHIDAMNRHIKEQAAQIEALQRSLAIVQSAAKTLVAAKDEQHAHMAREFGAVHAAAADVAGERAANAVLTDENELLRAQIEALTKDAERFRALGVCELQIYPYGHSPMRWMASFTERTAEGRPYKRFVTGPEEGGSFSDTASAVDAATAEMAATKAKEAK